MNFLLYVLEGVKLYFVLVNAGASAADALYVLPHGFRGKMVIAADAAVLATKLLPEAMCSRAPEEARELGWKLWFKLRSIHPLLFRRIGPACILAENSLRKGGQLMLDDLLDGRGSVAVLEECPKGVPSKRVPDCIRYSFRTAYRIPS